MIHRDIMILMIQQEWMTIEKKCKNVHNLSHWNMCLPFRNLTGHPQNIMSYFTFEYLSIYYFTKSIYKKYIQKRASRKLTHLEALVIKLILKRDDKWTREKLRLEININLKLSRWVMFQDSEVGLHITRPGSLTWNEITRVSNCQIRIYMHLCIHKYNWYQICITDFKIHQFRCICLDD